MTALTVRMMSGGAAVVPVSSSCQMVRKQACPSPACSATMVRDATCSQRQVGSRTKRQCRHLPIGTAISPKRLKAITALWIARIAAASVPGLMTMPSRATRRRGDGRARSAAGAGCVQCHGRANKSGQRLLVDLFTLVEVDGTPGVAIEAGVEEAGWIVKFRSLGKGHLDDVFVALAGADHSVMIPHRNPSPFPLFDHLGLGLPDQGAEPGEQLAPPVAQIPDPLVDHPRRRFFCLRTAFSHAVSLFPLLLRPEPNRTGEMYSMIGDVPS